MKIRALLVDDHAVFRSGLAALLDQQGDVEVVAQFGSGQAALRHLESHTVDVVIVDISMPGMSGVAFSEQALARWPRLAIVVLTMHDDEHYLRELFATGVQAFVLKQSTGEELRQAILAAYHGKRYIDPGMTNRVVSSIVGKPAAEVGDGLRRELTPRETEVCRLLAYGHTNGEIADKLNISSRTVESHRHHIQQKLGASSRADLVRFAIEHGLLTT